MFRKSLILHIGNGFIKISLSTTITPATCTYDRSKRSWKPWHNWRNVILGTFRKKADSKYWVAAVKAALIIS